MTLRSSELAQIVWAETKALGVAKADGSGDVNDARRMVAQLAASTNGDGFDRRESLPSADDKIYRDTVAGLLTVCEAAQNAVAPQNRLIFWQAGDGTDRPNAATTPAPPPPWDTMPLVGIAYRGRFQSVGDGRVIDLFARGPVAGDADRPVLVNTLTGTGLPAGATQRATATASSPRRWYLNLNWWIGLTGGALFFLAAFSVLWTSTTFGLAYDLLTGRKIAEADALANAIVLPQCPAGATDARLCWAPAETVAPNATEPQKKAVADLRAKKREALISQSGPPCVDHLARWASDEKNIRESKATPPPPPRTRQNDDAFCLAVSNYAVTYAAQQSPFNWLLGWHIPTSGTQTVSLGTPTALMMLGVLMVLIGLGRGVNGTPLGALISPNGRYSLALAQVTFWTVLILTSVIAIAIFNGGLVSELLRYFANISKDAAPVAYAKGVFPEIPEGIWGVLGITFGSTAVSVLMKSLKGYASSATEVQSDKTRVTGGIGSFKSPVAGADPAHRASIADWFLGEDEDNKDKIDISRVQMVLITAGLLVTYGNAIFSSIRNLAQYEIIAAVRSVDVLIGTLPPVGTTMAIMLAISHATYLVAKAAGTPNPEKDK